MSSPLVEWLNRIKERPVLALPPEPEELPTLLRRIDAPGQAAAITGAQYFGFIARGNVIVRLPLHAFTLDREGWGMRLFWIEFRERGCRAMRLFPEQVEQCAQVFRPPELLRRFETADAGNVFGPLRLRDLSPGEPFIAGPRQLGQVAREQREERACVAVWLDLGTLDTRKALWPGETPVFRPAGEGPRPNERGAAGRTEVRKGA